MPKILLREQDSTPFLDSYLREGGYATWMRFSKDGFPQNLLDIIEESGLTGKGGAGFPVYKKMRLMCVQNASRKYLIVNGSEHEPGSLKDRVLLERNPHAVIEGALLAALAVQATDVLFAINERSTASLESLRRALRDALTHGNVDLAGIDVEIRLVPDIYIVGEESALLEVLEGNKPLPRRKPPFPIQKGLHGFPTLIHNVETVAHLPFIASAGANAYRALGVNGGGVTLCTLGSEFANPGVYEIPLGTAISDVLSDWGEGLRDGSRIKAVQPGGPSSGFLAAGDFHLPLDGGVLTSHGSALGCAVIRAYSENDCMVREIGQIMHFFAHGSCGQCPRCRMETTMLDTIVRQVSGGKGSLKLLEQVDKIVALAQGEGICTLINMPVPPLRSGLRLFYDEFLGHIEHKCPICSAAPGEARSTGDLLHGPVVAVS